MTELTTETICVHCNVDICGNYGEAWLSLSLNEEIAGVHPQNLQNILLVKKEENSWKYFFGCEYHRTVRRFKDFQIWWANHLTNLEKIGNFLVSLAEAEADPFKDCWEQTERTLMERGVKVRQHEWD